MRCAPTQTCTTAGASVFFLESRVRSSAPFATVTARKAAMRDSHLRCEECVRLRPTDIYDQILPDLQSAGNTGEISPRAVTQFMVAMFRPTADQRLHRRTCSLGRQLRRHSLRLATCSYPWNRGRASLASTFAWCWLWRRCANPSGGPEKSNRAVKPGNLVRLP